MIKQKLRVLALTSATAAAAVLLAGGASAQTVWTDWTSATAGAPGSAAGTLNGVAVTYSGELGSAVTNGSSTIWAPATSFAGGTVTSGPASRGDAIFLNGTYTGTNTLSFATPMVDPVFGIWSLGSPSVPASFTFTATPTLEAGGPNSSFGGSSITVTGNTVAGREGNGVVQFTGTFSSISWTDTYENYYAFTVGQSGQSLPAVPEPATYALMLAGLGIVGAMARRRRT